MTIEPVVLLTLVIFVATYALIATERIDKTIAALLGGTAVVLLGIVDQEEAFGAIDLNVIFLLSGMMVMAAILRRTGFFQWLAIRSVKVAGGDPFRLLVVLSVVCAVLSALVDNVTTVVLLAPVTLYIASVLRVSPVPFLIAEILASNIGGTATLIGDPPNILIGSAAGLSFVDFLANMTPIAVAILLVFLVLLRPMFGRDLAVHADVRDAVLALDEREVLSDIRLLRLSLVVLGATIIGFVFATPLGLEAGTIALFGAAVLTLLSRLDVESVLREVEWPTLFFFVGLFMLVEAVVHVGIIDSVAAWLIDLTGGDPTVTTLGLLWLSGIASAIVDNIPYTATMIPVVEASSAPPACRSSRCGGRWRSEPASAGTPRSSGRRPMSSSPGSAGERDTRSRSRTFVRYGVVVAVISLVMSTGYLYVRYLA